MSWQLTAGANAIVGVAYLAIAGMIAAGLIQSGRLTTNRLGLAAGLVFLTCGVGFCAIPALMAAPALGLDSSLGEALREVPAVALTLWALLGGATAALVLSQRPSLVALLVGPGLNDEAKARERQAFEVNDNIVQGLSVAKYSLDMGRDIEGRHAIDESLMRARELTAELLGEPGAAAELGPGELRRERPASVWSGVDEGR